MRYADLMDGQDVRGWREVRIREEEQFLYREARREMEAYDRICDQKRREKRNGNLR